MRPSDSPPRSRNRQAEPATPEPEADRLLEAELFGLLGELEHDRELLAQCSDIGQSLGIRATVAKRVAEFAESRLRGEYHAVGLAEVMSRHATFQERAAQMGRGSSGSFAALLGLARQPKLSYDDRRQIFAEALRAWTDTVQGYFALFEGCFQSPTAARRWAGAAEVFLIQLGRG